MKAESYFSEEKAYVAGESLDDALKSEEAHETPQDAWNALGYWEREQRSQYFEVYEISVTTRVTKVDPPYSPRS